MCLKPIGVDEYLHKCRKCPECNMQRKNEWIFRIKQEMKEHSYAYFMTWTYNDKYLPTLLNKDTGEMYGTLRFKEMQDYWKRIRKYGYKPRYYVVGEYGSPEHTQRPHYHAIVFGVPKNVLIGTWSQYVGNTKENKPIFEPKGRVTADKVEHGSIRYVVKYMSKRIKNTPEGAEKPKASMSKGIGSEFINHTKDHYLVNVQGTVYEEGGYKIRMPKYYENAIYGDNEEKKIHLEEERINFRQMKLLDMKRMSDEEAIEDYFSEKEKYKYLIHKENKTSKCNKL